MVNFKGEDTKNNAIIFEMKSAKIYIWKESNITGTIRVENKNGKAL